MTLEEKEAKILELQNERVKLLGKITKQAKLPPPKRNSTAIKRAWKVVAWAMSLKMNVHQENILRAQPFPKGSVENNKDSYYPGYIIQKSRPEIIIKKETK